MALSIRKRRRKNCEEVSDSQQNALEEENRQGRSCIPSVLEDDNRQERSCIPTAVENRIRQGRSCTPSISRMEYINQDSNIQDDDVDDPGFSLISGTDSKYLDQVECSECHKKYKNKRSFAAHVYSKHRECSVANAKMPCLEESCNFRATRIVGLITHLIRVHKNKFKCEKVKFQNQDEFWTWKKKAEKRCRTTYSAITAPRELVSGDRKVFFRCNRSGYSKPSGLKESASSKNRRSSMKINAVCTSFINALFLKEGGAVVNICKTHYGHSEDNSFIRMNDDERGMIKDLIMERFTTSEIIDAMKAIFPRNRHQLFKYANIRNVSVRENLQINRNKGFPSQDVMVLKGNKYDHNMKSCNMDMNLDVENEVEIEACCIVEPSVEVFSPHTILQKHKSAETCEKEQLRSDVIAKAEKISKLAVGLVSESSLLTLSNKLDSILNYMNDEEHIQIIPDEMEFSDNCDQIRHRFDDQRGNSISLLCSDKDVH